MSNRIIDLVIREIENLSSNVILVENNDSFLFRRDIIAELSERGIVVSVGNSIKQRIDFELRNEDVTLILLSKEYRNYLDDILAVAVRREFFLSNIISGYHIPSIIDEDINILSELSDSQPIVNCDKIKTLKIIDSLKEKRRSVFDVAKFQIDIENELNKIFIDWGEIIKIISIGLAKSIGTDQYVFVMKLIEKVNEKFQENLEKNYNHIQKCN